MKKYKVNAESRESALGYKVNAESRESALGYKVNAESRESALGYLIWTIVVWLITVLLVSCHIIGLLPLSTTVLLGVSVVIFLGAMKHPREFFWLFLATLPLEVVILSNTSIPIAIRPFQLVGGILAAVLVISSVLKNKNINFQLLRLSLPSLAILKMKVPKIKSNKKYLNPIDRIVIFLGVAGVFSAQFAPDTTGSLKLSLVLVSFIILYWVARNFTRTYKDLIVNTWFFLVGVDAVMLVVLYQALGRKFGWETTQVMSERINATFTEPNWLGMYLVFVLAICLGLKYLISSAGSSKGLLSSTADRIVNLKIGKCSITQVVQAVINIWIFCCIVVIGMTVSRSAWLGAGIVLLAYVVIVWLKNGIRKAIRSVGVIGGVIILALGALSVFGLSNFHLADRATSSVSGMQKITISCQDVNNENKIKDNASIKNLGQLTDYGCQHINLEEIEQERLAGGVIKEVFRPDPSIGIRRNTYTQSWGEIKKHWLLGQGLGSSNLFLGEDDLGHKLNTSNIFLEVWVSMGVVGLLLFMLIIATPFVVGLKLLQVIAGRTAQKEVNKTKEVIGVFFVLTFFAILIPNLFNTGLFLAFFWIWLAMVMSYLSIELDR